MNLGWRHWSVAFAVAVLLHAALLALRWSGSERTVQRSVVTLDLQTPDNLPEPIPVSLPSSLAFAWQLGAEPESTRPLPDVPGPAPAQGGELSATLGGQSLGLEALTGPAVAAAANLAGSAPSTAEPQPAPRPAAARSSQPQPPAGGVAAQLARNTPRTAPEPAPTRSSTASAPVEPGPAPPDQVRLVREQETSPEKEEDEDEANEDAQIPAVTESAVAAVETREPERSPPADPGLGLSDTLSLPEVARTTGAATREPTPPPSEPGRDPVTAVSPAPAEQPGDRPSRAADLDQAIDQALAQTVQSSEPLAFPPPSPPVPQPAAPASLDRGEVDRALSDTLSQLAQVRPERSSPPAGFRLPTPTFEPDPADRVPQQRAPNRNAEISRALTGVQSQFGRDERLPDLPPPPAAQTRPEASGAATRGAAAPSPGSTAAAPPPGAGTVAGRRADPRYDPQGRPGAYSVDANDFFSRIADHIFRANDRFIGRLPPDAPRVFLDVRFSIDRAGRVMTVDLLRSSGDARLDQAAREVIWRASPMPALAQDMVSDTLELTFPVVVAR
ncbi:MAG: TonB family protein [Abyssibacter sp.]|uniref:TonB family protein n=1 Tax=Abyssibacter sp. TaxID=2320200 RepID=UPI003219644C